jgi:multiple sugar transport system permease protein
MKAKTKIITLLNTTGLTLVTFLMLFPIIIIIFTSLKPADEIFSKTPTLFPHHFTLRNYESLLALANVRDYMINSLLVAGLATVITMIIASLASYALVWMRSPGKRLISRSVFLVYMFPRILLVLPLSMICYETHLIDSRFALVLIFQSFTLPFSIWLMKAYFESIPSGLIEAAKLDGCNDFQCMWKIALPVSLPIVATSAVLSFVLAWNEYLYSNTLILNDYNRPFAAGLQTLIGYYHVDYGLLTAAGVILVVPVIVLFLIVQKYIVRGFAFGNTKG